MADIRIHRIEHFVGGWFIGDFAPSIFKLEEIELGFKRFQVGDTEPEHFQRKSSELTFVIRGECRLGNRNLVAGDIAEIPPRVSASFEALSEVDLLVIKIPSIPEDKKPGRGDVSLG